MHVQRREACERTCLFTVVAWRFFMLILFFPVLPSVHSAFVVSFTLYQSKCHLNQAYHSTVCDDSFSSCGGCAALAADRANQLAIAQANCNYKSSFSCPLSTQSNGAYNYVALSTRVFTFSLAPRLHLADFWVNYVAVVFRVDHLAQTRACATINKAPQHFAY